MPKRPGSLHLLRLFGIDVFLHWTWAVVALIELRNRSDIYDNQIWNIAEYLALFAIVLMHEFGHALACRSVGGVANQILLWPFGGIAYVSPPPRPAAHLWSIVAGPLVNVVLFPALYAILHFVPIASPDVYDFFRAVFFINLMLLIFNLLPIYPLDGGQILRSLLWFILGPIRSLMIAAVIGFLGAGAFLLIALYFHNWWLVMLALLGASQSFTGWRAARYQARIQSEERTVL